MSQHRVDMNVDLQKMQNAGWKTGDARRLAFMPTRRARE